ncbi:hypothetical protein BJ742DRAFT_884663 [Cladochytrium replicatum]|nr:hypothetical protein BJ742DRAFT_884663 [Cladochytrium replicatum]
MEHQRRLQPLAEISWLSVVHSEIAFVVATMRKNQRWSIANMYGRDQSSQSYRTDYYRQSPSGTMGSLKRGGSGYEPTRYDYCEDFVAHGLAPGLEAVLEFTSEKRKEIGIGSGQDSPLLQGFARLKARLTLRKDLRDLDPLHLLEPFLEVIKSGDTTGPITSAALSSVESFVLHGILHPDHPNLPGAMSVLVHSVTHCKFEATDAVSDEIVLTRILKLLRVIVNSDAGRRSLDDKGICEMVEAAFGMCFQSRVSELLRRSAEQTLVVLTRALFERLEAFNQPHSFTDPNFTPRLTFIMRAKDQFNPPHKSKPGEPFTSAHINASGSKLSQQPQREFVVEQSDTLSIESGNTAANVDSATIQSTAVTLRQDPNNSTKEVQKYSFAPYGLPAILELVRVLTTLMDPRNRQHSDSVHRMVALGLLNTALEVGGRSLCCWISWGAQLKAQRRDRSSKTTTIIAVSGGEVMANSSGPQGESNLEFQAEGHGQPWMRSASSNSDLKIVTSRDVSAGVVSVGITGAIASEAEDANAAERNESGVERRGSAVNVDVDAAGRAVAHVVDVAGNGAPPGLPSIDIPSSESAPLLQSDGMEQELPPQSESALDAQAEQEQPTLPTITDDDYDTDEERMAVLAKDLITNEMCRFLFQIIQAANITVSSPPSNATMTFFTTALKVTTVLLQSCKEQLKFQAEWLIKWMMSRLDMGLLGWDVDEWSNVVSQSGLSAPSSAGSGQSTVDWANSPGASAPRTFTQVRNALATIMVGEVREVVLDCLVQLSRSADFHTELYVNYDGDLDSEVNLFEDLIRFLCKHSFPDATPGGPATTPAHQTQCLDAILLYLGQVVERQGAGGSAKKVVTDFFSNVAIETAAVPTAFQVVENKRKKRILMEGATRFNEKPKDGIDFLKANGFLPENYSPEELARLLRTTPKINKHLLGEYLAKPANVDVMHAFVGQFEFTAKRIDEALRMMLESFRLPGESQQIERVMDKFSDIFFKTIEGDPNREIEDQSATFLLAYSVIMLNTDQHNPQVRRRMTFEDFQKNTRGINNGKNFSADYLKHIFDTIRENEIVMPEEHEGDLGFSYAWRELIKRSDKGALYTATAAGAFDQDMFSLVRGPIVAALAYAFDNAEDDLTMQKAVVGLHHCALIASSFGLHDVLDNIIISLSKITGLLRETDRLPPERSLREDEIGLDTNGRPIKVDPWAVEFGRSYRGQVAAVLMFNFAMEHGNTLRNGWKSILVCIRNLFLHSLLPITMLQAEDFVKQIISIPRVPSERQSLKPKQQQPVQPRKDAGLLSTISQFLSLGGGPFAPDVDEEDDIPPTAEELDCERHTLDCVRACRVEDVFVDSRFLQESSLIELLQTISDAAIQNVEAGKHGAATAPVAGSAQPVEGQQTQMKYNAASAFLLEIMVNIAVQNRDRIQVVWPQIRQFISGIFSNAQTTHHLLVDRAIVGLIRLISRIAHKDEVIVDIFSLFEGIPRLPQDTFSNVAEQLMAGILVLAKDDLSVLILNGRWRTIFGLVAGTSMHQEAASYSFEVATILINDEVSASHLVNEENFAECVDLLISFAVAAGGFMTGSNQDVGSIAPATTNSLGSLSNLSANGRSMNGMSGYQVVSTATPPQISNLIADDGWSSRGGSPKIARKVANQKSQAVQAAIERALRAVEQLYKLHFRIPKLVKQAEMKQSRGSYFEFWLPILSGLGQQCYHPSREVRQSALTFLQRALLSPDLESDSIDPWIDCFENVLFPLLDELLKPAVFQLDPQGMDETRMRASGLLCKIFLQYLNRMMRWKDLPDLWVRILQYLNQYMHAGGEYLYEGVLESLKNMLLVMSTQGVFQPSESDQQPPPSTSSKPATQNLWDVTWKNVNVFLPTLKEDLFPVRALSEDGRLESKVAKLPPEESASSSIEVGGMAGQSDDGVELAPQTASLR